MIHIARRHYREDWRVSLDVFLDGKQVGRLAQGMSVDVRGTGRPQQLVFRWGTEAFSPPLCFTDPGEEILGVVVSYHAPRGLFSRTEGPLLAEIDWMKGKKVEHWNDPGTMVRRSGTRRA